MPEATLKHVRGMAHASAVRVLDPAELSESVFIGEYVAKSRPCLIKGAAGHWSALKKWRDREYLKNRSGHHNVFLYPHEYRITRERMGAEKRIVKFAEAIDYLHSEEADVAMVVTGLPVELQADTGGFPFLTRTELAFSYSPIRFFFYKNAGTTWHYHPFDETLMCQIVGTKQVGLLDANSPFHIALRTFFFREEYYDNPAAFEGFDNSQLEWLTATLEEGDVLYIPPLWWHGVVPRSAGFGATASLTWRSPPHVIAETIRNMAAGKVDMIGKDSFPQFQALVEMARRMGLERELAIAWKRGV